MNLLVKFKKLKDGFHPESYVPEKQNQGGQDMNMDKSTCYTFEEALRHAVRVENQGFQNYLEAMRKVKDPAAKEMLRDAALEELDHKFQLEKALVNGYLPEGNHFLENPVPTMNLDYVLKVDQLSPQAGIREALAFAIHLRKESLDFYRQMSIGCAGAPMAELFEKIGNDESRHLQNLEDLYEEHFLPEN